MLGHLDQLEQLDELTGPVDYARFLDTVRAEIRALKAGDLEGGNQGALGLRGVSVLDVNALRHLRFRAVAVLGLTERSFPPPPTPGPAPARRRAPSPNAGRRLHPAPARPRARPGAAPVRARHVAPPASGCSSRPAVPPRPARARSYPRRSSGRPHRRLAGQRLDASELGTLDPGFYRSLRAGRIGADDVRSGFDTEERDISLLETRSGVRYGCAPRARAGIDPRRGAQASTLGARARSPRSTVCLESPDSIAALDDWLDERCAARAPRCSRHTRPARTASSSSGCSGQAARGARGDHRTRRADARHR